MTAVSAHTYSVIPLLQIITHPPIKQKSVKCFHSGFAIFSIFLFTAGITIQAVGREGVRGKSMPPKWYHYGASSFASLGSNVFKWNFYPMHCLQEKRMQKYR